MEVPIDVTSSSSATNGPTMLPQSGFALVRTTIADLQSGDTDLSRYKSAAKQWIEYQQQQVLEQVNNTNTNSTVVTDRKPRAMMMRYWITGQVAEVDHVQATYKVADEFGRTIRVNAQYVKEELRRKLEVGYYVSVVGLWRSRVNMILAHVMHIFEDEPNAYGSVASSSSSRLSISEIRRQAWKLLIEKQNRFLNRITIDLS
jgi:hypothetical protein